MSEKPFSKRHHYLPVKYLNGFTDSQNGFWIYDKHEDRIFKSGPTAIFFEKHLNTVQHPDGRTSDFLEGLYAAMEKQSWVYLDSIRKSVSTIPVDFLDKANLFLFLLFLHWRLPSNIPFVEKLAENAFSNDEVFGYFRLVDKKGEVVPQQVIEGFRNLSAFKKSFKILVPFAPFYKNDNWAAGLNNWRFLYASHGSQEFILGDNPLITQGQFDHDPLRCLDEFIFPVSGGILLVNIRKPLETGISPSFILPYSTAIIQRAQRFVASPNETFLKGAVERLNIYVKHNATHIVISDLFATLQQAHP